MLWLSPWSSAGHQTCFWDCLTHSHTNPGGGPSNWPACSPFQQVWQKQWWSYSGVLFLASVCVLLLTLWTWKAESLVFVEFESVVTCWRGGEGCLIALCFSLCLSGSVSRGRDRKRCVVFSIIFFALSYSWLSEHNQGSHSSLLDHILQRCHKENGVFDCFYPPCWRAYTKKTGIIENVAQCCHLAVTYFCQSRSEYGQELVRSDPYFIA